MDSLGALGRTASVVGVAVVLALVQPACAQVGSTGADLADSEAPAIPEIFDPASYGLEEFKDPQELYVLLTREGRCPPKKMAEIKQPCALILYELVSGDDQAPRMTFKPVFKVMNRSTIWAIHGRKLKKVKIENLYYDEPEMRGKQRAKYRSIAIIGNAENQTACAEGRSCLSNLVAENMFLMYRKIPDAVAEILWETRMVDPSGRRPQ